MLAVLGYVAAGLRVGMRIRREGKDGQAPSGVAVYRKDSYTPEGQRLLAILLKWWVFGAPFVFVLAALLGGTLCRLTGWSRSSP
jgi:hypothetical protein